MFLPRTPTLPLGCAPGPCLPHFAERTARKSRWSLLYCHKLAKRLEAALEDFSLSGLG